MENKKILKIAGLVILGGVIIGFSIKPIKKMIANYRGENSKKNKETTSIKSDEDIKKDTQLLEKAKQELEANKLTQGQADKINDQINKIYEQFKYTGLTYQANKQVQDLVEKLSKGGYVIKNDKAVKK